MAKLTAGLFSTPSGHNNGLVFGKGRTREGKRVTVRAKVDPTNPNTLQQQNQRSLFRNVLDVVRSIGNTLYSIDFDSAIGSLPGFQSLMSILLDAGWDTSEVLQVPDSVNLGNRQPVATFSAVDSAGSVAVTWTSPTGGIQADDDIAKIILYETALSAPEEQLEAIVDVSTTRVDGTATIDISGFSSASFNAAMYFQSAINPPEAVNEYSPVKFVAGT